MRLLKVVCENIVDCIPEVVKWNSWDSEHLISIHAAYSNPRLMYMRPGFGLFIDSINIPIFNFKIKTMVFTAQDTEDCQVSYCLTPFFLSKNSINVIPLEEKKTLVKVTYEFEANLLVSLAFPLIKKMIIKWNKQVWMEDLPLKLRRQKALEYGFVDFSGIPDKIENRKDKSLTYKTRIPVPKPKGLIEDSHPFFISGTANAKD